MSGRQSCACVCGVCAANMQRLGNDMEPEKNENQKKTDIERVVISDAGGSDEPKSMAGGDVIPDNITLVDPHDPGAAGGADDLTDASPDGNQSLSEDFYGGGTDGVPDGDPNYSLDFDLPGFDGADAENEEGIFGPSSSQSGEPQNGGMYGFGMADSSSFPDSADTVIINKIRSDAQDVYTANSFDIGVRRDENGKKKRKKARGVESEKLGKKKKNKLSGGKKAAISVLLVLYVLILLATSWMVFYRPKGEESRTVYHTETYIDSDGNVHFVEKPVQIEQVVGNYNFLVLGHDRAAMLTDVFMLVNLNANNGKITVMQIPRDTWISDHNGKTVITNKINALFSTYYNSYFYSGEDSDDAYLHALEDVAETLEDNLGIGIHASAIMDLNGFCNIVDLIGGVEVDIPSDMYYSDPEQGLYINLPAGRRTLSGSEAEGFVRYRVGYVTADLGRQNAQKIFMVAFFNKLKNSIGISTAVNMAGEIYKNITTDFKLADSAYFIQAFLGCDLSDITLLTMPGNLANSYYVMNRRAMLDVINNSFNVFDKDIPLSSLDPNGLFNDWSSDAINNAYNRPADEIYDNGVFNGDEVNKDSIDIY